MRFLRLFAVGLLFVGTCLAADVKDNTDGNDLLDKCNAAVRFFDTGRLTAADAADNDDMKSTWCLGYVTGVMQSLVLFRAVADTPERKDIRKVYVCYPEEGVSAEQAVRVIVKYLKDHPEKLHEGAALLSWAALRQAFPCR